MHEPETQSANSAAFIPPQGVALETVLRTDLLHSRPVRTPDFEAENRTLSRLVRDLSDSPETILQSLADVALEAFNAGSAGVSLISDETGDFYWPAIAGAWSSYIGGGTPRNFGPCGVVLDTSAGQLFQRPERYYPYLLPALPVIHEVLLAPFFLDGDAVGTIWVVSHDPARQFDLEDLRMLTSLGSVASAGYQTFRCQEVLRAERERLRQSEARFRAFTNATGDIVYQMSPDWSEMRPLRGRQFVADAPEPTTKWLETYVLPEDQARVTEAVEEALRNRTTFELENRVIRVDGSVGWTYSRAIPIFDETGEISEWFGAASDITQKKEAEEAVRCRQIIMEGQREALQLAIKEAPLEDSLGKVVATVVKVLGGDTRAAVYLSNKDKTALHHVVGMCREYAEAVDGFPIGAHSLACGLASHTGEPVITRDVREEPLWKDWVWLADRTNFRACWSFPIHTSKERFVGTLAVYSAEPREASERDIEFCSSLTDTASVIISKQAEAAVRKETEKALSESARLNAVLSRTATRLLEDSDPQRVVVDCCREVLEFLDCQAFFNYLYDPESARLRLNAYAGVPDDEAKNIEWLELGKAVCGCVARDRERIIAENIATTPDARTDLVRSYGIQAYCCHPLMVQGRLIGTLSFGTQTRSSFSLGEIEAMKAVTDLVAIGMNRIQIEQTLRESQELFRRSAETFATLVEKSPLGIYTLDSKFRIRHISSGSMPAFRNVDPLIGRDFAEALRIIWPEPFATEAIDIFRHVLATGEQYVSPGLTEKRKDIGAIESYEWQVNRVLLDDNEYGVVCYYFDTTRIEQAKEALRLSEQRFRLLADNAPVLIWINGHDGVDFVNRGYLDFLGVRRPELSESDWTRFVHPDDRPGHIRAYQKAWDERSTFDAEFRFLRHDGVYRWMRSVGQPRFGPGGEFLGYAGVNVDVTEMRAAEEARLQKETLQRMISAQEDERRRIAQDIHDHLGQQLTALRLQLQVLESLCNGNREAQSKIEQTQTIARQIDSDVDFIAWELRPSALDDVGLAAALEHHIREWSSHFEIDAQFRCGSFTEKLLAAEAETNLYRIVQEALNNIAKHARAKNVDISLSRRNGHIVLVVEDDGVGFRRGSRGGIESTSEMGLMGMTERAAQVGGEVEIESAPGKGSTVYVRVPVSSNSSNNGTKS